MRHVTQHAPNKTVTCHLIFLSFQSLTCFNVTKDIIWNFQDERVLYRRGIRVQQQNLSKWVPENAKKSELFLPWGEQLCPRETTRSSVRRIWTDIRAHFAPKQSYNLVPIDFNFFVPGNKVDEGYTGIWMTRSPGSSKWRDVTWQGVIMAMVVSFLSLFHQREEVVDKFWGLWQGPDWSAEPA